MDNGYGERISLSFIQDGETADLSLQPLEALALAHALVASARISLLDKPEDPIPDIEPRLKMAGDGRKRAGHHGSGVSRAVSARGTIVNGRTSSGSLLKNNVIEVKPLLVQSAKITCSMLYPISGYFWGYLDAKLSATPLFS
jgi:hypothetical protein